MRSSTSPRAFSDRRLRVLTIGVIVAAPVMVLALLQANYVLAYQACADRSNVWVNVPNAFALAAGIGTVAVAWMTWRRGRGTQPPLEFLATVATLVAVLSLVLIVSFAIPPLILHPCD